MFKLLMVMVLGGVLAVPAFAQDKPAPREGPGGESRQQMIERLRKRLAELEKGEPGRRTEGRGDMPREEMRKRTEPRREEMRKRMEGRKGDAPRKGEMRKRFDKRQDARPGQREGMRKGMDKRKGKDMRPERRGKFEKHRGKMEPHGKFEKRRR